MKRSLVTGGAGFIGSHLCARLLERGHAVLCLDNFQTGRKANVAHLLGKPGFELKEHDITTAFYFDVDEVYNLACPASPAHYQADPIRTIKVNVFGSYNVLELGRHLGARVLQASTSEVYGDPAVHPQPEDYWGNVNPIGVRSCYDEGKRCAETLFFDYRRQYATDIKVARIFNTYGPNMDPDDGRVVCNFIVQALRGEPLTVYGDGTQTRSFCFVSDLVDGLLALMDSRAEVIGPINLGNPGEFTVLELAHTVLKLTGSKSRIEFRPLPEDDPRQRRPDIRRAHTLLGWMPKVELEQGLALTIDYFRQVLAEASDLRVAQTA